jgi:hypothetical protein
MIRAWCKTAVRATFLCCVAAPALCGSDAATDHRTVAAQSIGPQQLDKIVPGRTSKTDVQSLLGEPWRVVQFNDCGQAMDDQADEIWEYRAKEPSGAFRIHVEFDDRGVVHLFAKIPDSSPGGTGTAAKVAPSAPHGISM